MTVPPTDPLDIPDTARGPPAGVVAAVDVVCLASPGRFVVSPASGSIR